ncbi:MAG: flavin reductase family protein [Candidatus Omnitrophica bacterium]|nr:flavin reductase family protein [Candidatus Omnitrophota bacterium]
MRKDISLALATRLINHGPVVLISSMLNGKANVTPVAWLMPLQKDPPMLALVIDPAHHIHKCIFNTGDFVINIPPSSLVEDVVKCGSVSGKNVDKIDMCGFTLSASRTVNSPAIDESIAVLECILVRDEYCGKKYDMVIGEVKRAEVEEELFHDHWIFEDRETRTLHHLGNHIFCVPDGELHDLS